MSVKFNSQQKTLKGKYSLYPIKEVRTTRLRKFDGDIGEITRIDCMHGIILLNDREVTRYGVVESYRREQQRRWASIRYRSRIPEMVSIG